MLSVVSMKTAGKRIAVSFLCVLAISNPTKAALISVDLITAGDGLVTRDTVENLDWLDVGAILGLSFNAVASSIASSAYSIDYGFGFATVSQMRSLFLNAGVIFPYSIPGGITQQWVQPPADFVQLIGATANYGSSTNTVGYIMSDDGLTVMRGMLDVYSQAGFAAVRVWDVNNPLTWQVYSPWVPQGAWLVRDTPQVSPVPLPGSLTLYLISVMSIALLMRKRIWQTINAAVR